MSCDLGIPVWRGNLENVKNVKEFEHIDFIEIDLETLLPENIENICDIKKFAFHAPHSIKFSHLYENVEKVMVNELINILEFATNKKAEYITYHFNFPSYGLKEFDRLLTEKAKRNATKLLEIDKKRIVFENTKEDISSEMLTFLVENGAYLCLDTGHLATRVFEKERTLRNYYITLEKFLEKFGKRIKVIHLHNVAMNNSGRLVDHTLNGHLDILKIVEMLKSFDVKYIVLEIFSINAERVQFNFKILWNFIENLRKFV